MSYVISPHLPTSTDEDLYNHIAECRKKHFISPSSMHFRYGEDKFGTITVFNLYSESRQKVCISVDIRHAKDTGYLVDLVQFSHLAESNIPATRVVSDIMTIISKKLMPKKNKAPNVDRPSRHYQIKVEEPVKGTSIINTEVLKSSWADWSEVQDDIKEDKAPEQ